jgi:hypothetical protein
MGYNLFEEKSEKINNHGIERQRQFEKPKNAKKDNKVRHKTKLKDNSFFNAVRKKE